uniref:Uncharacterized protein n=1 Tax=Meloidogyne enterolobii TaxID=390850 RepID=A0A6V7VZ31_MELEN|nr:unnamed protein product [Meloidogyne enterolobii]
MVNLPICSLEKIFFCLHDYGGSKLHIHSLFCVWFYIERLWGYIGKNIIKLIQVCIL